MKLQYYLRGLGSGILVTAMTFCILPGEKESLSDEEIRVRAAELGMVESSSLTLADIQNNQQEKEETPPSEVQPEKTEIQRESSEVQQESTVVQKSEETEATTIEGAELPEENATAESTALPEKEEGATEVLNITVESGASSYTVSKLLEESLLIEDAVEFDNYLINNGYSRKIRDGTHKIPVDATWEEIAKIISGK